MKDSFGGTMMLYIFIFFLAIYIVFISLTLRYAQAFKVKNAVIDIIERHEGVTRVGSTSTVEKDIQEYIKKLNIPPNKLDFEVINISGDVEFNKKCFYKVTYDIDWDWAFLNLSGTWRIKGESKNVEHCAKILEDNIKYS